MRALGDADLRADRDSKGDLNSTREHGSMWESGAAESMRPVDFAGTGDQNGGHDVFSLLEVRVKREAWVTRSPTGHNANVRVQSCRRQLPTSALGCEPVSRQASTYALSCAARTLPRDVLTDVGVKATFTRSFEFSDQCSPRP
jgi:hypothetical protein